jgi:murein DD-endopeptidase MepM/ murein hydrolase activator NlpD
MMLSIAVALLAVVVVPLAFAALQPATATVPPLNGGVLGAVSASRSPAPVAPSVASVEPWLTRSTRADPDPGIVRVRTAPSIASLTGYVWPIRRGQITLLFTAIPGGTRIKDGRLFHDGVDMAANCGEPVGAAHAGVVLAVGRHFDEQMGWIGDLGPYFHVLDVRQQWQSLPIAVVIDDGNGYRSVYAHFRDVTVRVGQQVRAGQLIGHEGATGHASGCHVHYELFSPFETKTFGVRADLLRRLKLPRFEIARIDPLDVLPGGDVARQTRSIIKAIAMAKETATAEAAAADLGPRAAR